MENYSSTENVNDAEFPQTGATANSTDSSSSNAHSVAAKEVLKVKCIEEPVRTDKNSLTSWKPPYDVERGSEGSLKEIIQRSGSVRIPSQATPVPTGSARYGTTDELFSRLQGAIASQALVPEETSKLLTCWTIASWFSESLPIAPALTIIAPEFEGNQVLCTLRHYCRYPLMLAGVDLSSLQKAYWHTTPTLLCYAPNLSRQMATIISCGTTRGYLVGGKDLYSPKAVFLGQEPAADRVPRCSLKVRLLPTDSVPVTRHSLSVTEAVSQDLRNRLLRYRTENLVRVYKSEFDAPLLSPETRAIANALASCIIDSPALQANVVSFFSTAESERLTDRSTSLEAVTLEGILDLCHRGKPQILVSEIAAEVNRILKARGERMQYSAETIGHQLKKICVVTHRLGRSGKGLVLDLPTIARLHNLAAMYGVVGMEQDENDSHCPLCENAVPHPGA